MQLSVEKRPEASEVASLVTQMTTFGQDLILLSFILSTASNPSTCVDPPLPILVGIFLETC